MVGVPGVTGNWSLARLTRKTGRHALKMTSELPPAAKRGGSLEVMQRGGFRPSGGEVLLPVVVLVFLHELRGGWSRLSPEQWVLFRPDEDPVPLSLLEAASLPVPAVEF